MSSPLDATATTNHLFRFPLGSVRLHCHPMLTNSRPLPRYPTHPPHLKGLVQPSPILIRIGSCADPAARRKQGRWTLCLRDASDSRGSPGSIRPSDTDHGDESGATT